MSQKKQIQEFTPALPENRDKKIWSYIYWVYRCILVVDPQEQIGLEDWKPQRYYKQAWPTMLPACTLRGQMPTRTVREYLIGWR